ncbi:MAG: hypothetical protein GC192_23200 [Bacteroidetes bacterium]|nr:hypothetical protein [Bacteroidota bacterium]
MPSIRYEIPEKIRFKKLKNVLLHKREFIDFAIRKFAESTYDDGKELIGWAASDYFGMQTSIINATKKSRSIFTIDESIHFENDFAFKFNDIPLSFPDAESFGFDLCAQVPRMRHDCKMICYLKSPCRDYSGAALKNLNFYEAIWNTLMYDELFIAELKKKITQQYRAVRRLYIKLFHSHSYQYSITYDLSKYYEYFDIVTTLRKGSEFVQSSTNSVKMADTSRKPFIKNGKSFKPKIYPIAA